MKNLWILASAEDGSESGQVVGMEDDASSQAENATTSQDGSNGQGQDNTLPEKPQGPNILLYIMLPLFIVYIFIMFRGPKKKQQEHQKMVSSLQKNDRVRTIGGIFGTVLDVRDDEIVLKIDESTNTKMRVSPQAIATVLKDKNE